MGLNQTKLISLNDLTIYTTNGIKPLADKISQLVNKEIFVTATLYASGWRPVGLYSFELTWPSSLYDFHIEPDYDCTAEEYDAWADARIVGNAEENILKALGQVPTIDIPIIVKVVMKVGDFS